jgi:hypothetical protein
MNTPVTDEDVRQLAATAQPYSIAMLRWGPERHQERADDIEREHQRRMVSLRADGIIAILGPIQDESLAGLAVLTVPHDAGIAIMADDPCVRARMMHCDVYPCLGFPGDSLPPSNAATNFPA